MPYCFLFFLLNRQLQVQYNQGFAVVYARPPAQRNFSSLASKSLSVPPTGVRRSCPDFVGIEPQPHEVRLLVVTFWLLFCRCTANGSRLDLNYRTLFSNKEESILLLSQLEKLEKYLGRNFQGSFFLTPVLW